MTTASPASDTQSTMLATMLEKKAYIIPKISVYTESERVIARRVARLQNRWCVIAPVTAALHKATAAWLSPIAVVNICLLLTCSPNPATL